MSAESETLDQVRDDAQREADLQKLSETIADMPAEPGEDRVPLDTVPPWFPSGPVARAFVLDPAPVTLICGPWGSGKTTALFVKLLLCACAVPPSPVDGVRYARVAVVRDTYRNLETNTIPSWQERFPKDMGKWKGGGGGEPGAHVIDFVLEDDTTLHLEVLFVAVGDHNVKQFCDGLQITAAAFNGLDELPPEILKYMRPRTGRWPPPQHRPANWKLYVPYWRKLMGDMNAPELDNWTVVDFQTEKKPSHELFLQPGGDESEAENLENLPDGYYRELAEGEEDWWVERFVNNKFGYSRKGTPVYTKFNPKIHVAASELKYDPKRLLVIGLDAQKDACGVSMQRKFSGRLEWLRLHQPPERMTAEPFGKWLAADVALHYPNIGHFEFSLDPSGFDPNGVTDYTWAEVFGRAFGLGDEWFLYVKRAPTNDLDPRIGCVGKALMETDAFAICPVGCQPLIRAFMSGYRHGDSTTHGDEIQTADPIKNEWSHKMEAGQYGTLRLTDSQILLGRKPIRRRMPQEVNFDPLDGM